MIELVIHDPEAGLMVLNKMRLHPQITHIPVIIASTTTQLLRDNEQHLRSKGCDYTLYRSIHFTMTPDTMLHPEGGFDVWLLNHHFRSNSIFPTYPFYRPGSYTNRICCSRSKASWMPFPAINVGGQ
jgi:hypothetical protein